jgi:uncharacterized protein YutE (UPF0331/DUF86 family)
VVDEGRVARLLRGIAERTGRLRAAFDGPPATRGELWLDGVKYLLVTTIEGCVDVAQHICSSENLGAPDSNAGAIRLLGGTAGIVPPDLAERLALAVGFRNVLVHQYAIVDDRIVLESVSRLVDFDRFVADVSAWMTSLD